MYLIIPKVLKSTHAYSCLYLLHFVQFCNNQNLLLLCCKLCTVAEYLGDFFNFYFLAKKTTKSEILPVFWYYFWLLNQDLCSWNTKVDYIYHCVELNKNNILKYVRFLSDFFAYHLANYDFLRHLLTGLGYLDATIITIDNVSSNVGP